MRLLRAEGALSAGVEEKVETMPEAIRRVEEKRRSAADCGLEDALR